MDSLPKSCSLHTINAIRVKHGASTSYDHWSWACGPGPSTISRAAGHLGKTHGPAPLNFLELTFTATEYHPRKRDRNQPRPKRRLPSRRCHPHRLEFRSRPIHSPNRTYTRLFQLPQFELRERAILQRRVVGRYPPTGCPGRDVHDSTGAW